MKFLVPAGGMTNDTFGIITGHQHKDIPSGIVAGLPWAADNGAFTGFNSAAFFPWLETMTPYRDTCLFVVVPDVVGDSMATWLEFVRWQPELACWPLAYVAQDGQEKLPFPAIHEWDTLFIGGSTEWKVSQGALDCIGRAQHLSKRVHVGRVNWWKRYAHFRLCNGSDDWTCDGTRQRFDGIDKTLAAWAEYQQQTPLFFLEG